MNRFWKRCMAILSLTLLLALVAASCGDDDVEPAAQQTPAPAPAPEPAPPAAEGGLAEAQAAVNEALSTPIWTAAGPPIDVGDSLQGKQILWIQSFSVLPFWQQQLIGYNAAMEAAGAELTIVDPNGDLVEAAKEIEAAIDRGFDLIQLGNETPAEVEQPIRAAKEAGIALNCMFSRDPGPLTDFERDVGCNTVTTSDYTAIGRLGAEASFVLSDGDPTLQGIAFNAPGGSGVADLETLGYINRLLELCPTCDASQVDAPPATWATDVGPLTSSLITANPGLDWLFPIFGGAVQFAIPSIDAAGATDQVRIGTQEGSTTAIAQIQNGDLAFTISLPLEWFGLATADVAFRLMLGEPAPDHVGVPLYLYTADNVSHIDAKAEADETQWFGFDYRTPYFEHWGLTAPEGYLG